MRKNIQILNLGAGNGALEACVYKQCDSQDLATSINWTGTDITNKTLKKLKQRFLNCTFCKAKLTKLPFKNKSFDMIFLLEVLEYIKSAPNTVLNCFEDIKDGDFFMPRRSFRAD